MALVVYWTFFNSWFVSVNEQQRKRGDGGRQVGSDERGGGKE